MRNATLIAMLLLLSPFAFAADAPNPQLATSAQIEITQQGTVTIVGGGMKSLSMNLSIPRNSEYQSVESGIMATTDSEGNSLILINERSPSNPYLYSFPVKVITKSRVTKYLPESYAVPPSLSKYTVSTARTQSDNAEIRKTALEATAGASDQFEKAARLAIFVNQNVVYDEKMVGQEKDAVWILNNKRGVCTEYSTLFAALARSIGIPVRYVSGYVYSERFGSWVGHAWTEAYLGEWVPVDPTWFEVGRLDAFHVEESLEAELSDRNVISAIVTQPGSKIDWVTPGKSGATANNVVAHTVQYSEADGEFELGATESTLSPGQTAIAYLSIAGKDYSVLPVMLASCDGQNIVHVSDGMQFAILRPGKATTIAWLISAEESVDPGFIYTCPLTLNSPYLEHATLAIKVDPGMTPQPDFSAELESATAKPGAKNGVFFFLPPSRRGKLYTVFTGDGVYSSRIDAQSGTIPFTTRGIGPQMVYAAAQGGGAKLLEYDSLLADPGVSIDSLSVPQFAVGGKSVSASARISAKSYPSDLSLTFSFCGNSVQSSARIASPSEIEFDFTPSRTGTCTAKLSVLDTASGAVTEKNTVFEVFSPPSFSIEKVTSSLSGGSTIATLSFRETGSPVSPTITVDGNVHPAGSTIAIPASVGDHTARLEWRDSAGNIYAANQDFTVLEPGIGGIGKSPCPFSLSIILASGLFIIIRR